MRHCYRCLQYVPREQPPRSSAAAMTAAAPASTIAVTCARGRRRRFLAFASTWIFRLGVAAAATVTSAQAVPSNVPFQVVRPTPSHTSLMPVAEGLAQLAQHEGSIALLSVVGPYHSGKSFLLNALIGDMRTFSVGPRTSPETMGMWLCRTNLTAQDGSEVWLMDSEGFYGPGVDEGYDAKVFTLAALVGAHVIYNTVKIIDQQAVSQLEMLVQRAQLFRTRNQALMSSAIPEILRLETFPPLTWVVEDFVQELPKKFREEGATGWLRTYLDNSGSAATSPPGPQASDGRVGTGEGKEAGTSSGLFSEIFKDVRVHPLFLPATGRDQLQDLSRLQWNELTAEFRHEVTQLRQHILRSIEARQFDGKVMTGHGLAKALRFLVDGLQQGMFHELPSLWQSWSSQVGEVSLSDAEAWYKTLSHGFDSSASEEPVPLAVFNERADNARERVTAFYRSLLRGFNLPPRRGDLRQRLDVHLNAAVTSYHERIRRWVTEGTARFKASFAAGLSTHPVPTDPEALQKNGEATTQLFVSNFSAQMESFTRSHQSSSFASRWLGGDSSSSIGMPAFSKPPSIQLAADLRTLLSARVVENDRAVQDLFKQAALSADNAAAKVLNASVERLFGKSQIDEVSRLADRECWEVFDRQLGARPWAKTSSFYKPQRAHLLEHLKGRLGRFASANDQRLTAHLLGAVERIVAAYHQNRTAIPMPAAEADVQNEHANMAAAAKLSLLKFGGNLSDTEPYRLAARRLASHLEDGLRRVLDKNIELWKVNADEATRCARELNRVVEQECGWLCLYNIIPSVHKATCRRNLLRCLEQSPMGGRMAPALQSHVVDMWYTKDLGNEAARVSTRLGAILVTFATLLVGCCWASNARLGERQQIHYPAPQPTNTGQGWQANTAGGVLFHDARAVPQTYMPRGGGG
eukprot:TRINITY_DN74329_c0_g1_i1.p1 TRINITY_DN74329_c0_g1~~TRINITY_DN74329_c0_g1_i1.p1  ORF type:complete len:920 (-),score=151.25 TRINITY_DN74329_c0_g1_i1:294-3053(-)